jgi:lactate dehydrogenase-like 2-hydroxyacid dehydrogenase
MIKPEILQLEPMLPIVNDQLQEHFTVHKLWLEEDHAALYGKHGTAIRAVAVGGHEPVRVEMFEGLPNLEIVASFGVGYDHIDAAAATERGVVVTNTPDVLSDEVADLAIGLLISTVRQLPRAEAFLRNRNWVNGRFPLTASMRGRKVGILGLGRIGKAIARRLSAFDLEVVYCGRHRQDGISLFYYPDLLTMAEAVDILISAAPGGPSTQGIINAEVIAALGPEGVLINVGRGTVVDEQALAHALESGALAAAGLDVFNNEPNPSEALLKAPNTVLLPHIGSGTVTTRNAMGQLVVDNLISWFSTGKPLTPIAESQPLLSSSSIR